MKIGRVVVHIENLLSRLLSACANPRRLIDRLRSLLAQRQLEWRQRLRGDTLWTKRGGFWLPFHGDGDQQELQYQQEGDFWFAFESQRLAPYLPKDGVVIDVGANLGFTALLFVRHVGSGGKVFAFEPSATMCARLQEVLAKNDVENVQCLQFGCGVARGVATLLVPTSSGNATIMRDGVALGGALREERVEIDTLDNVVLPLVSRVDFLKIDTEGFEDAVLAGASELIERHRPTIYIELSQEYGDSSARAIAWLRERGYTFDRNPDLNAARNGDNFLAFP